MPANFRRIGDIYLAHNATVTGDVRLGPGANLWFNVAVRGDLAPVTLGERCNLQDGVIVHTDFGVPNDIGDGVSAGHGAVLHGRRVGRGCLIGMGAVLLGNCELGEECLIAAGCVVPERMIVPPRSLVAGVPGRIIKPVTDAQLDRMRRINAHYAELAKRYANGEFPSLGGDA